MTIQEGRVALRWQAIGEKETPKAGKQDLPGPPVYNEDAMSSEAPDHSNHWSIQTGSKAIRLLVAGAEGVEEEDISDLITQVLAEEGWKEGARYRLLNELLSCPKLTTEHLTQILDIIKRDSQDTQNPQGSMVADVPAEEEEILFRWIGHPNMNGLLLRNMIEYALQQSSRHPTWGERIRSQVFQQAGFREHPDLQDLVLKHVVKLEEFKRLFEEKGREGKGALSEPWPATTPVKLWRSSSEDCGKCPNISNKKIWPP